MSKELRNLHTRDLELLIQNLHLIKEDMKEVEWYIKEGVWAPQDKYKKFPDLVLVYKPTRTMTAGYGVPIELKHCERKRNEAIEQLRSGNMFIEGVLKKPCLRSVFVIARNSKFIYDRVYENAHYS